MRRETNFLVSFSSLLSTIFQLHSFDFPVSITVSVIHYFPVSVSVTVNLGLFFSYCSISVSVTVNRNNTARYTQKCFNENKNVYKIAI